MDLVEFLFFEMLIEDSKVAGKDFNMVSAQAEYDEFRAEYDLLDDG